MFPNGVSETSRTTGPSPAWSIQMIVFRHIAAECRDDRVFALMVLVLGSWTAFCFGLLALNVIDVLPPS
ncbi:hypothetical protein ME121_4278 [Methylobacterium sp. ME121]|nr:hypothetical protein ME121_4278 [Methylobacterium sp. ME121]